MNRKSVSIGIDLGMTYSSMAFVGVIVDGSGLLLPKPEIATDKTGTRIDHQFVPSQVCAYVENGDLQWAIGTEAKKKAIKYGQDAHLFQNYKLQIGESFLDEEFGTGQTSPQLQALLRDITPDFVAQKVIEYLYQLAFHTESAQLNGYGIDTVSVSIPALWPERKKKCVQELTRLALQSANVQEIQLIEEPVAAFYFQIRQQAHLLKGPEKHVIVVDYGGGTCDVAVVKIEKDAERLHADAKKVAYVTGRGSSENGGVMIDHEIAKMLQTKLNCITPLPDYNWCLNAAENLKIEYSNQIRDSKGTGFNPNDFMLEHEVDLSQFGQKPKCIEMNLEGFTNLLSSILLKLVEPIRSAVNYANETEGRKGKSKLKLQDIHHVFLAGGTALLPLVKDEVRKIFEADRNQVEITDLQPRKAIVYGAALHAFQFDHGIGLGIGLTLQEDIWLKNFFGKGIRVAKRGINLPYTYKHSVSSVFPKTEEITVALYRGPSKTMTNNKDLETACFTLSKPAKFLTKFVFEVTINESGLMDFTLTRPGHIQDTFHIKGCVPFRADIDEMAERAFLQIEGVNP